MAATQELNIKSGATVRVKVAKNVTREAAEKTIERLFMKDKAISGPIAAREANFKPIPKRRGGRIWTKRPNKVHVDVKKGLEATIKVTPQVIKDLNSVREFIEVA
jgi:hypothetical protein